MMLLRCKRNADLSWTAVTKVAYTFRFKISKDLCSLKIHLINWTLTIFDLASAASTSSLALNNTRLHPSRINIQAEESNEGIFKFVEV